MSSPLVYYPAPERPFTKAELTAVIGKALESNPKLAQALRQVLAERQALAVVDASQPHTVADGRAHAGGRLAEINSLQGEIGSYIDAATRDTVATTGRKRSRS